MIIRRLEENIMKRWRSGKAIVVLGARQVGKTTLLRHILNAQELPYLWLNGDEPDVQALFQNASTDRLKIFFGNASIIVIDEAQRIPDIGLRLKLITE